MKKIWMTGVIAAACILTGTVTKCEAKTDEKIRILEEKLNYVGTYALDAICLLDVV